MKEILDYISEEIGFSFNSAMPKIWYTIENNTLGEAGLVVIEDTGEENFKGIFLSETRKKGMIKRFRKGFNTTNKAKILACSRLKNLVETDKIKIRSKNLISELKTYIAKGAAYEAKIGETDDLVAALLLIIRMSYELKYWDENLSFQLKDYVDDEVIEPMPFIVM